MHDHIEHDYESEPICHVHAINPQITVQADVVRCTVHDGSPVVGVAVGWTDDEGAVHYSAALLEPRAALSLANAILAAVGQVFRASDKQADCAVAAVISGRDWDREFEALLGQSDA